MIIPECESSHPISIYTNDQPVSQLLPSCESLLSGTEQLETSRTLTEGKKATAVAYDDLPLYSEWCPSIDSGIALSEAGTQYSASPSDSGRNMDRQEPQDPVSTIPSRTDSPVPLEMAVENVPLITSNQTRPPPLNEVVSFGAKTRRHGI